MGGRRLLGPGEAAIVLLAQVEWNFVWVSSHDIALGLARLGHRVAYCNPLPKRLPAPGELRRVLGRLLDRPEMAGYRSHPRPAGLLVCNPLCLPDIHPLFTRLNRAVFVPLLARRMRRWMNGRRCVVISFLPFATALALANALEPDALVYALRSNWRDDRWARRTILLETEFLHKADLVLSSGPCLNDHLQGYATPVLSMPAMVDFERFHRLAPVRRPNSGQPIRCCYFGHLNDRIDVELLRRVSHRHILRIVGPVSVPVPEMGKDTEWVGMVSHDRLPEALQDVDVWLLPYCLNEFTRGIFPYKLYECFATGGPVVSTCLPSLAPYAELVYLSQTHEEFLDNIERARAEPEELRQGRIDLARENSAEHWMELLENWIMHKLEERHVQQHESGRA